MKLVDVTGFPSCDVPFDVFVGDPIVICQDGCNCVACHLAGIRRQVRFVGCRVDVIDMSPAEQRVAGDNDPHWRDDWYRTGSGLVQVDGGKWYPNVFFYQMRPAPKVVGGSRRRRRRA